ncbi:MAG: PEP/pyruvate-binding domain-containing protein [Pseudomonadota bacterium]
MSIGFLDEYRATDVDRVGGKGANLGELLGNGFPIPPGFVVCADEYARVIAGVATDGAHGDYRDAIMNWVPSDDFLQAIGECNGRLRSARGSDLVYAVRSSATAEDLGDASFAGQHETYYYVTFEELVPMIRLCWASLWNEEALAYRDTQGISHQSVFMAVVVQEMIPSTVSGITFTANPLTGALDEVVTDATWGMGAAIVDGRVTPDHFVVARDSGAILNQRIANKTMMVSTTRPQNAGRMVDVPQQLQQAACLDDEMVAEVTRWALKAEAHFGKPQDLEWAIVDGTYYMLQSRPITTLGSEAGDPTPTGKLVLFKAFAENFTDPLTPLTADVLGSVFEMAVMHRGRMYMPLGMGRAIVPLRMTDEEAAGLMSIESPEDFRVRVNWFMVPFTCLFWVVYYLLLGVSQARSRRQPDEFMEVFRDLEREVDADESLSPAEAMARLFLVGKPFHPIGMQVMPVNVSSVVRYVSLMGLLNRLLQYWLPGLQRDAGSLLCSGSYGVKSTEMGRSIFQLSVLARQTPAVVEVLQSAKSDEIYPALLALEASGPFLAAFHEFLRVHGHRALKEFELGVPRFRENPAPVLAMIRNYLVSDSNPEEMEQHSTDARVALAGTIQAGLGKLPLEKRLGWRWRVIEYLADRTRHFTKLRENSRFYHIMAWQTARMKILRAEARLLASGQLKVRNDIFYLHWQEVRAMLDGKLGWSDVEGLIRARRMQNVRWSHQSPAKMLNIASTRMRKVVAQGQLGGQGASPGQYEGIARVILDPSVDAEIHPGEILIAPYTDPAWTPLFLVARAAVVGVGSYLSHAGTIAREYGMPCVVDVTDCTSLIRSGDRILVDGTEGLVHLLATGEQAA